jgi:hypothetical protein
MMIKLQSLSVVENFKIAHREIFLTILVAFLMKSVCL